MRGLQKLTSRTDSLCAFQGGAGIGGGASDALEKRDSLFTRPIDLSL